MSNVNFFPKSVLLPAIIIFISSLTACKAGFESDGDGGSGGNGGGTDNEITFIGPGTWEIELNSGDETFTIERSANPGADVDLTITGVYQQLDSGFSRLTVQKVSEGSTAQLKSAFTAIEIDDEYLLLLPIENNSDQIISTVVANDCPENDLTGNWITYDTATSANASAENEYYFGTYTYAASDGVGILNSHYDLETFTANTNADILSGTPCDDGVSETDSVVQYVSSKSSAMVHNNADNADNSELLFVMDTKEFAAKADMDSDSYIGFYYDSMFSTGAKAIPVALSCEAGECDMNQVVNIENGSTNDNTYQISFETPGTLSDSVVDGFVNGTISDISDNEGKLVCSVDINFLGEGRIVWACVGQSPTDPTEFVNLFVTTK